MRKVQIGPNCRIRKCYTKLDGSSQTISTNGQLLVRDGDVVGVKTSTRHRSLLYLLLTRHRSLLSHVSCLLLTRNSSFSFPKP